MSESEFMRRLRERVELLAAPHRDIHGDDAPVVRMAGRIMQAAEEIATEISGRRVGTVEAHEITGWSAETLQKWARAKLEGRAVPNAWTALEVDYDGNAYTFVLGTIPPNPRLQAAS